MAAQDQVIWTGRFELDEALAQFNIFAEKVQAKMGNLSKSLSSGSSNAKTNDRVTQLLHEYEIAAEKAEEKLEQFKATVKSALDKGLIDPTRANSIIQSLDNKLAGLADRVHKVNVKTEENVNWTKSDVLALRAIVTALDNFDTKLHQADRTLALTNLRIKEQDKAFKEMFYRIVVGGFALQQLGMLMTNTVTRPMIEMGKVVLNTGLEFEQFEKRLEIVAGKSKAQIASIYDTVRKVAKEPNITLTETMQLFNNLLTIGKDRNLTDAQLETFGKGYTRALEAVTSTEKKSILDFITDVFSTGEFGQNVEKSLQLAPRLNKAMRDVLGGQVNQESLKASGLDAFEVLMKTMEKLSKEPAADSIQNKIDNITDAFAVMGKRFFDVYKNQFLVILNWVETKVLPLLDRFMKWMEQATPATKTFVAVIIALTAAAGPLIYIFGTLGVVGGGLAFILKAIASGFALLTGNAIAASVATSGLGSLLAAEGAATGGMLATAIIWITRLIVQLPRLLVLITPFGLIISGVLLLITAAIAKSENLRTSLARAFSNSASILIKALQTIGALLETIYTLVNGIGDGLAYIGVTDIVTGFLRGLLEIGSILNSAISVPLAGVRDLLYFITDLINQGWAGAWANLQVRILETYKSLLGMSDIVHGIVNIFSTLISGKGIDANLDEGIDKAKKKNKELGDTVGETAKAALESAGAFKDYGKQVKETSKQAEDAKKFLDQLYEALKKEEDQVRKNILAQSGLNAERAGKTAGRIADSAMSDRSDAISDADLSNPQQREEARIALAANEVTAKIEARRKANLRIAKALKDLAISEAEVYRADQAKGVYGEQVMVDLEKYAKEGGDILKWLDSTIDDVALDAANKPTGSQPQQVAILTLRRIQATKQLLIDKFEVEKKVTDEIDEAIERNRQARKDFLKKVKEAKEEELKIEGQSKIQTDIDSLSAGIVSQTELADIILKGADTVSDIRTQLTTIKGIHAEIRKLTEEQAKLLLEQSMVGVTPDTNEARKIQADHDKLVRDNKTTLDKQFKSDEENFFDTLIKRGKRNEEGIKKAVEEYQKGSMSLLDQYIELAKIGVNVDAAFNEVAAKIAKSQITQNLTLRDSITRLNDNLVASPSMGLSAGTISQMDVLMKSTRKSLEIVQSSNFSDTGKLGNFIDQAVQLLGFLGGINDSAFPDRLSKAEFDVMVADIVKALENAKKLQSDQLKTDVELKTKLYEYNKAIYDKQQETLESKSNELELEKELLDLKKSRGNILPDIKSVKDFGKAIIAAITGGSSATYELEKRILENQKLRAENEYRLALFRLEYEKDIMILQAQGNEARIKQINEQYQIIEGNLRRESDLQKQILDEKISGLSKYGTTITEIFTNVLGEAVGSIFGKKKKQEQPDFNIDAGGIDAEGNVNEGVISDESADKTGKNVQSTLGWLDKLKGGLGKTKDVIFALGGALENLNDLSLKGIARALKEELKALGKKATIKALEYAAVALSALVFGDFSTAGKAGLAAAAWGGVAVAAYAGAGVLGTLDGDSAKNSASAQSTAAGFDKDAYDASRDNQILKQKLLSVLIQLDIRTDNGQIIKINQTEINRNTALTTLVANSAGDWLTQPGV
jgi:hypothetical protein